MGREITDSYTFTMEAFNVSVLSLFRGRVGDSDSPSLLSCSYPFLGGFGINHWYQEHRPFCHHYSSCSGEGWIEALLFMKDDSDALLNRLFFLSILGKV